MIVTAPRLNDIVSNAAYENLRQCDLGVGMCWTTWTAPRAGNILPFPDAVEALDVDRLAQTLADAGAKHLLFTLNHALHWLPLPHPTVDRLIQGRTCRRDLVADLITALDRHDIRLMLYYHNGLEPGDLPWQQAIGAFDADPSRAYAGFCEIISWMGTRYGDKVAAWWFDDGWALANRGNTPWNGLISAAKAGFPDRAVTFNPGLDSRMVLTPLQDYWSGETEGVASLPTEATGPGGLPPYAFLSWHCNRSTESWGMEMHTRDHVRDYPTFEQAARFVAWYRQHNAPLTVNLLSYQDGTFDQTDLQLFSQLAKEMP